MYKTVALEEGNVLVTKRMEGDEGSAFPKHTASLESALVVLEGTLTISFGDVVHTLQAGDTFVVPADDVHQVKAAPEFQAIHIMPKNIRFNFKA